MLKKDCKIVLETLKSFLGDKLISLILYGSAARGELRPNSDLDFYLFAAELPKEPLQRSSFLARMVAFLPTSRRVSLRGKTPEEIDDVYPLFLDLATEGIILYDRDNFAQRLFAEIRKKIEEVGLVRYKTRDNFYGWKPKKPLKRGESIIIKLG